MADQEFNYELNFQSNLQKVIADGQKLLDTLDKTSTEYQQLTIEARKLEDAQTKLAASEAALLEAHEKLQTQTAKDAKEYAKWRTEMGKAEETVRKTTVALDKQIISSNRVITGISNMNENIAVSARGFNSLSNSVAQIGREIPNFAQGAEIGIRALSNNIGPLVDSFDQIRQKGGSTKDVFRELTQAIFSMNTVVSLGITLLTVYGTELLDMATGAKAAKEAVAELKSEFEAQDKELKELIEDIQHQTKLDVESARQRGASEAQVRDIIIDGKKQELAAIRKHSADLKKEYETSNASQQEVIAQYRIETYDAEIKAARELELLQATSNTAQYNEQVAANKKRLAEQKAHNKKLAAEAEALRRELERINAIAIDTIKTNNESARETELRHVSETYEKQIILAKGNARILKNLQEALGIDITNINIKYDKIYEKQLIESQERVIKLRQDIFKLQEHSFDAINAFNKTQNELQYRELVKAELERFALLKKDHEANRDEIENSLRILNGLFLFYIETEKNIDKKTFEDKKDLQEKFNDFLFRNTASELQKQIELRQIGYKTDKKMLDDALKNKIITQEAYNDAILKLEEELQKDTSKLRIKSTIDTILQTAQMLQEIGFAAADLTAQLADNRLNDLQREFDERNAILEGQREKELSNEFLTAKQKDAINKKYAKEKLANDLKLEKEQNKLKKRQFETDKAFQISQSIINIAFGITKAVSSKGYLGIAEGIMIAATGAIQLAKIAATKFEPNQTAANASISADIAGGAAGGGNVSDSTTAQGQPNISFIGSSNNQLANTINGNLTHRGTPVFKTYVLASDVTNQAQLDRQLVAKNTI